MTKITKAEFEALPESLKAKFKAEGEEYALLEEDVEGLKKSKAEILQEKKDLQAKLAELEKFKTEHEAEQAKAAEADLEKKGKYEEALAAKEKAWKERLDAEAEKNGKILNTLHREQLKSELIKRGVLPDRVDYLASEYVEQTEFAMTDNGFSLKKKGGVGDAAEFEAMIGEAKTAKPFFFAANGASGSGASGSQAGGQSAAKTWTRAQWDSADNAARQEFSASKGQVTD